MATNQLLILNVKEGKITKNVGNMYNVAFPNGCSITGIEAKNELDAIEKAKDQIETFANVILIEDPFACDDEEYEPLYLDPEYAEECERADFAESGGL